MICADFLAGASLENEDPSLLLQSMSRFFKFLPGDQRQAFLHEVTENASSTEFRPSAPVCGWILSCTNDSGSRYYSATSGGANCVAAGPTWRFTTRIFVARVAMIRNRT